MESPFRIPRALATNASHASDLLFAINQRPTSGEIHPDFFMLLVLFRHDLFHVENVSFSILDEAGESLAQTFERFPIQ